jgi:peptidyl-tRNA hydrolase
MKRGEKLYVVTRRDMSPGYQAVQSIHAAQVFAVMFPTLNQKWHEESNYLGFLSVKDEAALIKLARKATLQGLAVAVFSEPDVDWNVTAIAIEASSKARRLCNRLPLALSEYTPL